MNKLKFFTLFAFSSAAMLLSSCGWIQGRVDDSEVTDLDKEMYASKRVTMMDEALMNLGRMLNAYDMPVTPIQSQNIGNETADKGVPTDLYVMVATAMNKIGSPVIFIPYDTQYIINESVTGGTIQRLYPEAVISGAITGVDKDLIQKEREGDAAGGWFGASGSARYSAAEGVSRMMMDLNMRNYTTQAYFPGVLASNSIFVRDDRLGWGVAASYMDFSVSFDSEVKTKQGIYAAFRFLVELSVVELVGKYFAVPYWKCIRGASVDKNMISRLKDNIENLPTGIQIRYIKKYLYLSGYNQIDRSSETLTPSEQSIFASQMKLYGVKDYPSLFISVWENLPMDKSLAIIAKDKQIQKREQRKQAAEARDRAIEEQKIQESNAAEKQRQLELKKNQFDALLNQADKDYSSGRLSEALDRYSSALTIFPDDQYTKDQIARTRELMNAMIQKENQYNQAIASGDEAYNIQDYKTALKEYQRAQMLKPNDTYAADMVIKSEKALSKFSPTGIKSITEDDWISDGNF